MAILTTTNQGLNFIGGTTFIQTGTSTVMSMKTNGSVGIGTTDPSNESNLSLGAKSTTEGGHLVLFKGTSQTQATHLDNNGNIFRIMNGSDASSGAAQFSLNHATSAATFTGSVSCVALSSEVTGAVAGYFACNGNINSNQIVHIRDSVATAASFSVGGIKISSSPGNDVFLLKRNSTNSSSFFALRNSSASEFLTINMSTGNVGIGVTSPLSRLQIAANQSAANPGSKNFAGSAINADGGDIATGKIYLQGFQNTANDLCGFNNEADRVVLFNYTDSRYLQRWDHTGNSNIPNGGLGIGVTTVPAATLEVLGTSLFRGGAMTIGDKGGGGSTSSYELFFKGQNSSGVLKKQASLNSLPYAANTDAGVLVFKTANSSNQILTERMRIDGVGNVGIGANNPLSKLEVNGTLNINEGGDRGLVVNPAAGSFGIGDLDGVSSDAAISGDGARIKIVGVSEYFDNLAAINAGLSSGEIYRTGDLLKIVH